MMWFHLCIFWGCVKAKDPNGLMKKEREEGIFWQTYSEEHLRNHAEMPYVVYVTADWCVTCAIFDQQVLQDQSIQQLFLEQNIMAMRADGTQDDQEIERLKVRYGVNMLPIFIYAPDPTRPETEHHVLSGEINKSALLQLLDAP